jgi:hypothetical protein
MTHLDIVKLLVINKADIQKPNFNGGTCLINRYRYSLFSAFSCLNPLPLPLSQIFSLVGIFFLILVVPIRIRTGSVDPDPIWIRNLEPELDKPKMVSKKEKRTFML